MSSFPGGSGSWLPKPWLMMPMHTLSCGSASLSSAHSSSVLWNPIPNAQFCCSCLPLVRVWNIRRPCTPQQELGGGHKVRAPVWLPCCTWVLAGLCTEHQPAMMRKRAMPQPRKFTMRETCWEPPGVWQVLWEMHIDRGWRMTKSVKPNTQGTVLSVLSHCLH